MSRQGESVVCVTGGAGYVGALVVDELIAAGHRVRVLDALIHGQGTVGHSLEQNGAVLIRGDLREPHTRRAALDGARTVVHLAAIVGDPACARDPETSHEVNVDATRSLVADARTAGVERLVFASTCSNYGRVADPTVAIAEDGRLAPVSLYAEQKVKVEQMLVDGDLGILKPTCLRFATVYGVAPRMRFDLTVNEFTRDLWAGRTLEVFGEQFWRPYIHVRDAARAVRAVVEAPEERVAGQVFNVGRSGENYRKLDVVAEIRKQLSRGVVDYVHRDDDPRDYKVSFDRIRQVLRFETTMTVADGVADVVAALDAKRFDDPFHPRYRNVP